MVDFDSHGLNILRDKVISGAIVEEFLDDPKITQDRRDTCSACEHMNTEQVTCNICKCFLSIKTKSKVNINVKKMKSEITHCPLDKWEDEFSRYYNSQLNSQLNS